MKIIWTLLWLSSYALTYGQSSNNKKIFEIGLDTGVSTYFGDLAPLGLKFAFSTGNVARGMNIGFGINDHWTIRATYSMLKIGASDVDAVDSELRKLRNLSFESDISEFALEGEFYILSWTSWKQRNRIRPFLSIGAGIFNFDPKALYNGEKVRLQPLGTEGQGLDKYPDKHPYKLTQFSVPVGGGIRLQLSDRFWIGCRITYRITGTDYLDDVSGEYSDPEALYHSNGPMSADLAYRTDEVTGETIPRDLEGKPRGNPYNNDWYGSAIVTFGHTWISTKTKRMLKRKKKGKCPRFD